MNKNKYNIELKKVLLTNLLQYEPSIHTIIIDIINNLLELSESKVTGNSMLNLAAEYILAYLQLGFSYLEHQTLFDSVLKSAGWDPVQISALHNKNKPIPLNKAQLRSIMGRWPASPHNSHNITDAINDIILRVNNNYYGTFFYYTAKKDGEYTALYQLTISPEHTLFFDVYRNNYYQLMKK